MLQGSAQPAGVEEDVSKDFDPAEDELSSPRELLDLGERKERRGRGGRRDSATHLPSAFHPPHFVPKAILTHVRPLWR